PPVYSGYRTDGGAVRKVAQFTGVRSSHVGRWNGLVNSKPAPEGVYAFGVTVENRALVAGSWPHRLPPKDRRAAPHTGLTIAELDLTPPLEPVQAGAIVRVGMPGSPRRVRHELTSLDGGK